MITRFYQKVDKRSRSEMACFLCNHETYYTMNSWNRTRSISNNIKLCNLGLPAHLSSIAYDLVIDDDAEYVYENIRYPLVAFDEEYDYNYRISTNGRSGGYLILVQGTSVFEHYESKCRACGAVNRAPIPEAQNPLAPCRVCGKNAVANATVDIANHGYSSQGVGEDWEEEAQLLDVEEYPMNDLREEVNFIQDFDKACDNYVDAFIAYCEDVLASRSGNLVASA